MTPIRPGHTSILSPILSKLSCLMSAEAPTSLLAEAIPRYDTIRYLWKTNPLPNLRKVCSRNSLIHNAAWQAACRVESTMGFEHHEPNRSGRARDNERHTARVQITSFGEGFGNILIVGDFFRAGASAHKSACLWTTRMTTAAAELGSGWVSRTAWRASGANTRLSLTHEGADRSRAFAPEWWYT